MKTSHKQSPKKSFSQVLANLEFVPPILKTMRGNRKDRSYSMPTLITQKQRWDNEGGRVDEISHNRAFASQTTKKDTQ